MKTLLGILGAVLLGATPVAAPWIATAEEVPTIRVGRQTAAEENLWLMIANPNLSPNLGKAYKVEWTQFRASDMVFKAFEGGQIDFGTVSSNAAIVAISKGLDLKILASLSRESDRGSKTQYLVRADGPTKIADLKGKTIGINGYRTSIELWARAALRHGGLDPDRDVQWAVVPFPAMADAIRNGKIAVGGLPHVFSHGELAKGDLRSLFTSKTGVPFDEELMLLAAKTDFIKKYPAATRAFLADLAAVNRYYLADLRRARQALLDAKLIALPPQILFQLVDYVRDPALRPSVEALEKQQELMLSQGFQETKINMRSAVDASFLPPN
ncbi:MAG: ABC transporter substrate-binding protein [Deltaproteobacteria bacterium]|nr:ABC transporter substrate-binding protein [Deltaproteobacteria bacterium]